MNIVPKKVHKRKKINKASHYGTKNLIENFSTSSNCGEMISHYWYNIRITIGFFSCKIRFEYSLWASIDIYLLIFDEDFYIQDI